MESSLGSLLVLITLAIIHIAQSQNQHGFISLDCGSPSPYNETYSGLSFSSDDKYIQSGKTGRVRETTTRYKKPYETLRYFPVGKRNCYNLDVTKGRKYLIRASFVYGNYGGRDNEPVFDLYLGPILWATIDFPEGSVGILHIPTSDSLEICLVKTGTTTPIISSLELRPLGENSYPIGSDSLRVYTLIYFIKNSTSQIRRDISRSLEISNSNKSESELRNFGDVYDRIWEAYFEPSWTQISTALEVSNTNDYRPPEDAVKNAATPTNSSAPLTIEWTPDNPKDQYYFYAHFSEIQDLQANETREFDIVWNGIVVSPKPVTPPKLHLSTVPSLSPVTCDGGTCIFQLIRTNKSTLPPLLNALELYTVIQFPQSETVESDVVSIKNIKATYGLSRINWQGDPCVPIELRWDGLNCSDTDDVSTPPRITSLNLTSSGLTGNIADAIQNLTQLEKLDLSNNSLTGEFPAFLGNIKSLLLIDLRWNDLNGSIPQTLRREGVKLLLDGNKKLCRSGLCTKPHSKKFPVLSIVASVASVAVLVAALVLFLVLRKNKLWTVKAPQHMQIIEMKKKRFTYPEVIEMTNNFQRVLGKGGFGEVYYGTLNDSEHVAVKVCFASSTHGFKQFKAEVDLLLRVHHTNLVSLVGYCDEGDHMALIYEFVPNGDLKEHLSGKQGRPIINWGMRLRIAVEAALGLEYLHIGCTPSMIHRDVKTTNILLGEHFQAKLADFGLSRTSPAAGETHVSTSVVAGTYGYLDPEYHDTGRLSEKSDVYSFGIVLLEIITNKPVINEAREKPNIAQWVRFELNQGEISRIMDPNLCVDYNSPCVWNALELAISCADPSSTKRPTMSQVVSKLKECLENLREVSELL